MVCEIRFRNSIPKLSLHNILGYWLVATNRKDIPQHLYTLDEYFALERAGDARYEYWDGEVVCMSGGSEAHSQICGNVFFQLRLQLGRGRCRAFTSDMPVKTPTLPPYRYPDVSVACESLYEKTRGIDVLVNPVLIVEVVSPTSAARDHEDKFGAYRAIDSLQEYGLVAQDTPRVTHYRRQPDGRWLPADVTELTATVNLSCVGCTLSLADIYEDVNFAPE
jgi:Uma2 family endonuclease